MFCAFQIKTLQLAKLFCYQNKAAILRPKDEDLSKLRLDFLSKCTFLSKFVNSTKKIHNQKYSCTKKIHNQKYFRAEKIHNQKYFRAKKIHNQKYFRTNDSVKTLNNLISFQK